MVLDVCINVLCACLLLGLTFSSLSFILEGLLTFLCAIPAWFIIPDFPEDGRVLKGIDRDRWLHRLAKNQGVTNAPIPFSTKQVWAAFTNWKTYVYALMCVSDNSSPKVMHLLSFSLSFRYIGIGQPFYSLALFVPTIIKELGYTNANANLLSVPPYAFGFITTLIVAIYSDRILKRGIFIVSGLTIVIVGYIILMCDVAIGVKYCAFLNSCST